MNRTAIYCRLSKEDYEKLKDGDESESIINQRMLLIDYAITHNYFITDIYIDDDYSGLYHDRPAFERLIQDAKLQKFDIIIAKTLSRFTRNMEHVEKYLHTDFPILGIRFIGVVDGIDSSEKNNKKARQINGLINEWYSEDLSENIKAVFREKMKKGQFLGSFACYGYQKDPKDNHKIIIDEEASVIVQMIFKLCLEGFGVTTISKKLTQMQISTPTIYKQQKGLKFYNPNKNSYSQAYGIWSTSTIKRILSNETYIGTLIQGREKKVSYKNKKVIITPKEEWIVIKNNHEPIISQDIFDYAQVLMAQRRKVSNDHELQPHLFAGKLKCADCGNTMVKTSGKSGGSYDYFICQLSRKTNGAKCTRHTIRYDDLKNIVAKKIHELFEEYASNNIEYLQKNVNFINPQKSFDTLKSSLANYNSEIDNINRSIAYLYADRVKGSINDTEYMLMKNSLKEKVKIIEAETENITMNIEKYETSDTSNQDLLSILYHQLDFKALSFQLINLFISRITIGEEVGNHQVIKIMWNI